MLKNILVYLAVLASAFVFSIYYYLWFSWVLFLIIACVPFLSLLFSLPFMISAAARGIMIFSEGSVIAGENFNIGISAKRGRVFCPALIVKIRAKNNFCNLNKRIKLRCGGSITNPVMFSYNVLAQNCGNVELRVNSCRVYDFMGIFFIPIKIKQTRLVSVMPKRKKPALMPDSGKIAVVGYKPKSGGGFSDYYELRTFHSGDSMKNVHWKASSKYDDLVVREPSLPIYRRLALRLDFSDNCNVNDDILARFYYVAEYFFKNGTVCLCHDSTGKLCEIKNKAELDRFIISLYSATSSERSSVVANDAMIYAISEGREEVAEQ